MIPNRRSHNKLRNLILYSLCIKIENTSKIPTIEEPKETKEESKDLMLHTILLQNNALREIPDVLHEIPSLKVIQLHGNPCASAYETFKHSQNATKPEEPPKLAINSGKTPKENERFGSGEKKFFGPSLRKVREVTERRQHDRQRQLQQIQVDRQLQLTRDYEARANFRRTFHSRPIHSKPIQIAPFGKGKVMSRSCLIKIRLGLFRI